MSEEGISIEDIEATFEDLEDICARLPTRFNFHYHVSIPTPEGNELHVSYSCIDHRYHMAIIEKGRAIRTRTVTREQFMRRFERYFNGESNESPSVLGFFGGGE